MLEVRDFELQGHFIGLDTEPFDLHHDKEFVLNFRRLADAINGLSSKKDSDAARTNQWPRIALLPPSVNLIILYSTGVLYCASRLIVLGVSFASMREMSGSVYLETNWTQYVPRFGASG